MDKDEKLTTEPLSLQECLTVMGGFIHEKNVILAPTEEVPAFPLPHIPHRPGGPGF